jgi:hypothetical protein
MGTENIRNVRKLNVFNESRISNRYNLQRVSKSKAKGQNDALNATTTAR